jgi:hypothetical protein
VSVAGLPAQTAAGPLTTTTGTDVTVTANVPVVVQPAAVIPVTEYVVVADGETLTLLPVKLPGIHV